NNTSNDVILTNRLGTDPYARWCERTDREIIPIFLLDLLFSLRVVSSWFNPYLFLLTGPAN
ncbi:hypothetical protein, partial [Leadbetterella byssophila]|uniref:hypothetical protein n=1 Tax=Leadbetterella byssophila TaxID=316068 RepID=UPI0039A2910F